MPFEHFLQAHGVKYLVHRPNQSIREEIGLPDKGYIMFNPDIDIKQADVLENPVGETCYITEVTTEFNFGEPHFLKAFFQTEQEHLAAKQSSIPVFNIQNAYSSVIGTNNQVTINYHSAIEELKQNVATDTSADKEQLEKIVSLLEMIINNQVPPTKGLFSKFRDVMERNAWFTGAAANALMSWLLTKIQ